MKPNVLFFLLLITTLPVFSQVNCGDVFTDSGGQYGDYGNQEDIITSICPDNPGEVVTVNFISFETFDYGNDDLMYIFNGPNIYSAPILNSVGGLQWDDESQNLEDHGPFTSTHETGCLTFKWMSNENQSGAGWVATINCILPPDEPVMGCMNPCDFLYNPAATIEDESLCSDYLIHCACVDPEADNYNTVALYDDGSCEYSVECGELFTDSGGAFGNPGTNEDEITIICPDDENTVVSVIFTQFDTKYFTNPTSSNPVEKLYIYDGPNTFAPLISTPAGDDFWSWNENWSEPGGTGDPEAHGPFTSSDATGCLTFHWQSGNFPRNKGWVAVVNCGATSGCLNPCDENFMPNAVIDDPSACAGFGDCGCLASPLASNYDPSAVTEDGSCEFNGACGGLFTDPAGPGAFYGPEDAVTVICPDNIGDIVTVDFEEFFVENDGDDELYIYDGPSINSPPILNSSGESFWIWDPPEGTGNPVEEGPFTSTDPSGCLTFNWITDGANTSTYHHGWVATVECNPPTVGCTNPCDANYNPSANIADDTACAGNNCTCLDPLASNYDPNALINGICEYVPSCGGYFTDSGGPIGFYGSNEEMTTTICPDNEGEFVSVEFLYFSTYQYTDEFYIYNGPNEFAPLFIPPVGEEDYWAWSFYNSNNFEDFSDPVTESPFTSTHPSGCLTFVWISDTNFNRDGWLAAVNCIEETLGCTNICDVNYDPLATTNDPDACSGDESNCGCLDPTATNYNPVAVFGTHCQYPPLTCGQTFYCPDDNDTTLICPAEPGLTVRVQFNQFTINNEDALYIYNGASTEAPLIQPANGADYWSWLNSQDTGTANPVTEGPFYSTDTSGCLTFVFIAVGAGPTGWTAYSQCGVIGCTDPCDSYYNPETSYLFNINCSHYDVCGCTDPTACNYDPDALFDDVCYYEDEPSPIPGTDVDPCIIGQPCNDGNAFTVNDVYDVYGDCAGASYCDGALDFLHQKYDILSLNIPGENCSGVELTETDEYTFSASQMYIDSSYTISLTLGNCNWSLYSGCSGDVMGLYIDWNQDGWFDTSFSNNVEFIGYDFVSVPSTMTFSFTIPGYALTGTTGILITNEVNTAVVINPNNCSSFAIGHLDYIYILESPEEVEPCALTCSCIGCLNVLDANFDPLADIHDESLCNGIPGCIDPDACNFDALANVSDGSCDYAYSLCGSPCSGGYYFTGNDTLILIDSETGEELLNVELSVDDFYYVCELPDGCYQTLTDNTWYYFDPNGNALLGNLDSFTIGVEESDCCDYVYNFCEIPCSGGYYLTGSDTLIIVNSETGEEFINAEMSFDDYYYICELPDGCYHTLTDDTWYLFDSDGNAISGNLPAFICEDGSCFYEPDCANNESFALAAKIFLEGPYIGTGTMNVGLTNLLPLSQSYSGAPYLYSGTETVTDIPANVVDWVLVELRSGIPSNLTQNTSIAETRAGFLLADGNIVDLDGSSDLTFTNLVAGENYHLCIRHRNHLDVMSANPITASGEMTYDFTTGSDKAYGTEQIKALGDGNYAMYAGDYTQEGIIQTTDYDFWFSLPAAINVYGTADGTLDGVIQNTDYDKWFFNKAKIGAAEIRFE